MENNQEKSIVNLLKELEEAESDCDPDFCVFKNCEKKNCSSLWKCKQNKTIENEEIEYASEEIMNLNLGKNKSMSIISDLISQKNEIFRDYSKAFLGVKKVRKSKKKRYKKPIRKRKQTSKRKSLKPFLQDYQKKWEKYINQGGSRFRNCLIFNPLILSQPLLSDNISENKKTNKIPFPSSKNNIKSSDLNVQENNNVLMTKFMEAKPRYSLQLRRKSSLVTLDTVPETLSPFEIKKCKSFLENGVCLLSCNCQDLHNFNQENKYQHLLSRFVNILLKNCSHQDISMTTLLNNFHSLQPALSIFQKLLFRKPETCIFELIQ
jgi:hypothetical protein